MRLYPKCRNRDRRRGKNTSTPQTATHRHTKPDGRAHHKHQHRHRHGNSRTIRHRHTADTTTSTDTDIYAGTHTDADTDTHTHTHTHTRARGRTWRLLHRHKLEAQLLRAFVQHEQHLAVIPQVPVPLSGPCGAFLQLVQGPKCHSLLRTSPKLKLVNEALRLHGRLLQVDEGGLGGAAFGRHLQRHRLKSSSHGRQANVELVYEFWNPLPPEMSARALARGAQSSFNATFCGS